MIISTSSSISSISSSSGSSSSRNSSSKPEGWELRISLGNERRKHIEEEERREIFDGV